MNLYIFMTQVPLHAAGLSQVPVPVSLATPAKLRGICYMGIQY